MTTALIRLPSGNTVCEVVRVSKLGEVYAKTPAGYERWVPAHWVVSMDTSHKEDEA